MGDEKDREEFILFMTRKDLSFETKKLYLIYHKKLCYILEATERELDQEIVNGFIDLYPHAVSKAFLKNYLEFKDLSLKIQKKTGTVAKKEIMTISDEELIKIRKKLYDRDERYGLIFDLSEGCALRRQEVINIKCSDISIKEVGGKEAMFILLKKTKGKKEREVFVLEKIAILILEFMAKNNLMTGSYLFSSSINEERPIDKTSWNKEFLRASIDATGKRFHPHQLRHHRSLTWYDKGIDIVRIQQRLGHSNIATTRLYINPDKRKEMEKWSKESD